MRNPRHDSIRAKGLRAHIGGERYQLFCWLMERGFTKVEDIRRAFVNPETGRKISAETGQRWLDAYKREQEGTDI